MHRSSSVTTYPTKLVKDVSTLQQDWKGKMGMTSANSIPFSVWRLLEQTSQVHLTCNFKMLSVCNTGCQSIFKHNLKQYLIKRPWKGAYLFSPQFPRHRRRIMVSLEYLPYY